MLTVAQTIDSIFKRIQRIAKVRSAWHIVTRGEFFAVISSASVENDAIPRGRFIVAEIAKMNLHNKPKRIGFSTTFVKFDCEPTIFCAPREVLIVLEWNKPGHA